ncbi:hypothetical protein HXA34_20780 [Salipaludibacillus agaradhaerens]|uniref:hypothetical protein n=1 Tax=Salipaludibacillus agaradhaerens TaxID=76935 RepID=UPI0021518528|nr:hypothetical protein [Salipaludibacillus agaradhaerens]MCR6108736.1 hypothetical protein [Salipaludibacillus agaradhaerens]MCR6120759.1 hypothetical protein [Salipaludibacillus agaradhaerens]
MATSKKMQVLKPIETNLTSPKPKKNVLTKLFGVCLLIASLSVFAQGIPLMFVFIGAYLGVPADAVIGNMDTMIWLLTSVTMLILSVYAFVSWMKFLWRRFIIDPKPLLQLFWKKEKHTL